MRFLSLILALKLSLLHLTFSQNRHNDYGVFDIPVDNRVWPALDELGVGWIREQFRVGEADLDRAMVLYDRIFEEGYGLVLTVHHRDGSNIANQQSYLSSTRGSYPPQNPDKYKANIRFVVQRLTDALISHGRNPAESLMIQFSNEVLPIDLVPDTPTRYWHGTSDEYIETLRLTFDAVKEIGQIPVINAGIASLMLDGVVAIDRGLLSDPDFEALYAFNERILREGQFDWVDVHLRHAIEDVQSKIDWVKERWSGKLIATEFAGPDVRTSATFTEALQAQELVQRMEIASSGGVDRILWSHLMENPAVEDIYFQEGLIEYQTWRKKPAFFAYKEYLQGVVTSLDQELEDIGIQFQNYPNPFSNKTLIRLEPEKLRSGPWRIEVRDLTGHLIAHWNVPEVFKSSYQFQLDGRGLPDGVYLCRLITPEQSFVKRMILSR